MGSLSERRMRRSAAAAGMLVAMLVGGCANLPPADLSTPGTILSQGDCSLDTDVSGWLGCREAADSRRDERALPGKPSELVSPGDAGAAADGATVFSSTTLGDGPVYLVVGPSDLDWTLKGSSLEIAKLAPNLSVSRTLLDRRKAGTGKVRIADAGTYLLRIKGKGPWRIEVATRRAPRAGDKG